MTKDDKLVRETILAELRRRRGLLGKDEERPDRRSDGQVSRPIYPPSASAGTTSE